jgi:hypothetical protein
MRYPCGTQLCVSQVMDEVTNTLLNAWKIVLWLLAVMCWSLQIVASALQQHLRANSCDRKGQWHKSWSSAFWFWKLHSYCPAISSVCVECRASVSIAHMFEDFSLGSKKFCHRMLFVTHVIVSILRH